MEDVIWMDHAKTICNIVSCWSQVGQVPLRELIRKDVKQYMQQHACCIFHQTAISKKANKDNCKMTDEAIDQTSEKI